VANWGRLLGHAVRIGVEMLARGERTRGRAAPPPSVRTAPSDERARTVVYSPDLDGAADPGEIVWTWVPFEEDDGRGKDRPLLVVGRSGADLLGLMLSSRADRVDDPDWIGIGAGGWDREGRPSYVRLDRVLEVGDHDIRREGAVLDRERSGSTGSPTCCAAASAGVDSVLAPTRASVDPDTRVRRPRHAGQ
jgi:hypothetical protein